jgi:cell wall-associated NlpC family hydrolase
MQIKRFITILVALFLVVSVQSQGLHAVDEKCEDNLVTTFSKYFSKSIKRDTSSSARRESKVSSYASKLYQSTIDNVISVGKTFLGIPYRWGGVRENGFDCSGFIKYIFDWFDLRLPRTSREMVNYGQYVSRDELQKGDLVFFSGRNTMNGVIGHIGIVVEVTNGVIKMMHSSSSKGVHIEDLNQSDYFSKRYITARRLPLDQMNTKQKFQ